jgi:hypothetical protein
LGKDDVAYLRKAADDYAFFADSVSILELLNRSAIDEGKLTWRKVADVARRHVAALDQPKTRKTIRDEVETIVRAAKGKYVKEEGKVEGAALARAGTVRDLGSPRGSTRAGKGDDDDEPKKSGAAAADDDD